MRQQLAALCRALDKSESDQADLAQRLKREECAREELLGRCEAAVQAASTARNAAVQETAVAEAGWRRREQLAKDTESALRAEIQRLNALIRNAEGQLLNVSTSWSNERRTIHQLQLQLSESMFSAQSAERELDSVHKDLRERTESWESERTRLAGDICHLREELSRTKQDADERIRQERLRAESELASRSEAFERSEGELKRLSAQQIEECRRELALANASANERVATVESELRAESSRRVGFERDLTRATQDLRRLQEKLWKASNASLSAESRCKSLEQELRSAREQLHSAASRSEVVQEYARSLERREADKSAQLENATAERNRQSERAAAAESSLLASETDSARLKLRIEELGQQESQLQDTVSRLRTEVDEASSVRARLAEVERSLSSAREEASAFEAGADAARRESSQLRLDIGEQQQTIEQLRKELEGATERAAQYQQRCRELEDGLAAEREAARAVQDQLSLAQAQASHLRLQVDNANRSAPHPAPFRVTRDRRVAR